MSLLLLSLPLMSLLLSLLILPLPRSSLVVVGMLFKKLATSSLLLLPLLPLLLLSALLLSFSFSLAAVLVVVVVAGRGPLPSGSVTRGEAGSTGPSDPGLVCDMAVGCSDVEVVYSSGFVPYSYTLNLSGIRPADFSCNRSGTLIFCIEQSVVEKRTLA